MSDKPTTATDKPASGDSDCSAVQRLENPAYTFSFAGMIADTLNASSEGTARYASGVLCRMFIDRLTADQCEEAMAALMRRFKAAVREEQR